MKEFIQATTKEIMVIIFILISILISAYVGIWVMFIGGLVRLINEIKATTTSGFGIGIDILMMYFSLISAFVVFISCIIIFTMLKDFKYLIKFVIKMFKK